MDKISENNFAPQGKKREHFAATDELAKKDVELAFRVFQGRLTIVRGPPLGERALLRFLSG